MQNFYEMVVSAQMNNCIQTIVKHYISDHGTERDSAFSDRHVSEEGDLFALNDDEKNEQFERSLSDHHHCGGAGLIKKAEETLNTKIQLEKISQHVRAHANRITCFDIFQELKVKNQYRMYPKQNFLHYYHQITSMKDKQRNLQKIQLVKSMTSNIFSGYGNLTYIKITLKEIKLIKEIFVMQLEQGDEVFIPMQLSMRRHSVFFQFYDPIFKIIEEMSAVEKKNFLIAKNRLNLKMAQYQKNIASKMLN